MRSVKTMVLPSSEMSAIPERLSQVRSCSLPVAIDHHEAFWKKTR